MKSISKLCSVTAVILLAGYAENVLAWKAPVGIPAPSFGINETVTDTEFTHWVDNTSAACSDAGNGTPTIPRCTMPGALPAGSILQIRGGPYTDARVEWVASGTAAAPVFIRGPSAGPKIVFTGSNFELTGSYGIIENIDVSRFSFTGSLTNHHLAIRHSHIHDNPGTGSSMSAVDNSNNIVIWDNEINNNGVIPSSADHHGISFKENTTDIWIVDNHIHHNSGDGIQFCHSCVGDGTGPARIYIGRNNIHHDEENAMDFKEFIGPVIVSENIIHDYVTGTFSGKGDAIRINDEGSQGDIWFLNNVIYNAELAFNPAASVATSYIIGNKIHDITGLSAIRYDGTFVINNTLYDITNVAIDGGDEVKNNIVKNAGVAIGNAASGCSHNLIDGGAVQSTCTNGLTGDPLFILDGLNQLLRLEAASPAIDAGFADHSVYSTFMTNFGIDIRPNVGVAWDIGADEYSIPPMPPTNLTVQ